MKKIINICLFFLILFIMLIILSKIFIPKTNIERTATKSYGSNNVLGEKDNTIDLVVLGNSEACTSIIPMKLWEDYGYTSYSCGNPGQLLSDSIKTLQDVMKRQKPKVVVLEATSIYDKISITIPIARAVKDLLPIAEYHQRWKNLTLEDFYSKVEYKSVDHMKGFRYKKISDPADISNYMQYTKDINKIGSIEKYYLKMISDYCKKNNIKLIIISVPSPKNWDYKKHNAVKKFADEEGVDYIDFNLLTDQLNIDWNTDTSDKGDHMNYYGSVKLTNYFEKYLNDKNLLQSHKDDKKYSKWNDDLKKYKETTNE